MQGDWDPDSGRLSRRRALTIGGAAALTALAARGVPLSGNRSVSPPEQDGPVQRLHDDGVTASGVRVGVLDTTGFAADHPRLDDAVVGRRSFDGVPVVVDGTTHGTAASVAVARTAPAAELLLASFERPGGFRRALAWFRRADVDVVLAPVAAYGASVAPPGPIADAVAAAIDAGIAVVAPTGNAARGHWQGSLSAGSARRLVLGSIPDGDAVDGRLLAWAGSSDADAPPLSLALVRTGQRELIALSERAERAGVQRLNVRLSSGRYALELRLPDPSSVADDTGTTPVSVVTPTHRLTPARRRGSIATPASAAGVLAVGRHTAEGVASYSGRGPTSAGRRGVDLVAAPRLWPGDGDPGTSGAAAYVAGVASLVAGVAPDTDPAAALRATASRSERPNATVGYGIVDPVAAVTQLREEG